MLIRQHVNMTLQKVKELGRLVGLAIELAWLASPRLVLTVLLLILVEGLLPPLNLLLYRLVLDRVMFNLYPDTVHDELALQLPLTTWIAFAAGGVVLSQLLQLVGRTLQNMASDRLTIYVTGRVIQATNRWQGLTRFEDPNFIDDLERTRDSTSQSGLMIMVRTASGVTNLFTLISAVVILSRFQPLVPLLLIVATIPYIAQFFRYFASVARHLYWLTPESRRLEYYRDVLMTPETAQDVRLYGLGSFFQQRYESTFAPTIRSLDAMQRKMVRPMALSALLASGMTGLVFVYLAWQVVQERLGVGDMVLYSGTVLLLQRALRTGGEYIQTLPQELHFLPGLFRVLRAAPDLPLARNPLPAPQPIRTGIVFEHVSFTYPDQRTPTLRDVSFRLAPGECVALVGHNGAGKTTIVKLLLRLYDPTAGRILLDGVDLREYDPAALRKEFSAIFQDFVRYDLTVGENIGLGNIAALHDPTQLYAAADKANASTLIDELPQGLETKLGRSFGGRDLSGGQWQKIALARAFMRDSQLLVLDEPTAALDVQTEYEIYTRFHQLTRERMTLLISHRFSTVRMATRMLYLAQGAIQEEGIHAQLMARDGEYARLYRLQAAQYLDESNTEVQA